MFITLSLKYKYSACLFWELAYGNRRSVTFSLAYKLQISTLSDGYKLKSKFKSNTTVKTLELKIMANENNARSYPKQFSVSNFNIEIQKTSIPNELQVVVVFVAQEQDNIILLM